MIEASGLLAATPGAPLPKGDTVGEIAAFADREAGQLDKANSDKGGVQRMGRVCSERQGEALKDAQRRTGPWWRRVWQ